MTWKSHDITSLGLEWSRRVYSLEESREVGKSLDNNVKEHINHIATT